MIRVLEFAEIAKHVTARRHGSEVVES